MGTILIAPKSTLKLKT